MHHLLANGLWFRRVRDGGGADRGSRKRPRRGSQLAARTLSIMPVPSAEKKQRWMRVGVEWRGTVRDSVTER